ncbi:expressed unknown protein [Seminavis robusta]|uniref:Tubby C-terminal domain-containing protein n=1 Tax=Seminavis robusta TaxID=568900 RepID=A0A9N8DXL2_9STRA|nr:expressed unknown protein [Seminavis robusta]|eukprot:Sro453_g146110.1 n/a (308) ;mRNA; r:28465-29388
MKTSHKTDTPKVDTPPAAVEAPAVNNDLTNLSIFEAPAFNDPSICNSRTGLVNGIARRVGNDRIVFFIQTGHVDDRASRKAVLVAQRQRASKWYLFDVSDIQNDGSSKFPFETFSSKDDARFVGKFNRMKDSKLAALAMKQYVGFSLFQGRDKVPPVQSILYETPDIKTFWKNKHTRTCHMVCLGTPTPNARGNGIVDSSRMEQSVKLLLGKKKTLSDVVAPDFGIYVGATNHMKNDAGEPHPIFHGRANKVAAHENMVLADLLTKRHNLQMVAYKKHVEWNVDFAFPNSAFTAFAFALSQLEMGNV